MQVDREDHDEHQRDNKLRHRLEEHGYDQHQGVDPGVFLQCGYDAENDTDDRADGNGAYGDDAGSTQSRKDLLQDRFTRSVGIAEVSLCHDVSDIAYILYYHRIIQTQFFSLFLNLLLRRSVPEDLSRGITGRDGLQYEDDGGDAQQDGDQKKDSFNNIL